MDAPMCQAELCPAYDHKHQEPSALAGNGSRSRPPAASHASCARSPLRRMATRPAHRRPAARQRSRASFRADGRDERPPPRCLSRALAGRIAHGCGPLISRARRGECGLRFGGGIRCPALNFLRRRQILQNVAGINPSLASFVRHFLRSASALPASRSLLNRLFAASLRSRRRL